MAYSIAVGFCGTHMQYYTAGSTLLTQSAILTQQAGGTWARMDIGWSVVDPSMNGSNYQISVAQQINAAVALFAKYGVKLLIPITTGYGGGKLPTGAQVISQYAAMCAWLVTQCPGLAWEVLNEPDHSGTPADTYAAVTQAAYQAMKAADPTCTVVAGVIANIFGNGQTYWSNCYANGIFGYYDAISIHTYTNNGQHYNGGYDPGNDLLPYLAQFKTILANNGDGATPLWITEFGWDDNTTDPNYSVNTWQQATFIYLWLTEIQNQGISVAISYKLIDDTNDGDGVVHNTTYSPKPAWYAVRGVLRGGQQPHFVANQSIRSRLKL